MVGKEDKPQRAPLQRTRVMSTVATGGGGVRWSPADDTNVPQPPVMCQLPHEEQVRGD
jgi:hypothetical protein